MIEPIGNHTFQEVSDEVLTVIGDEKQPEFYSRIKIKKWNNDVNFSLGYGNSPPDSYSVLEDTIEAIHNEKKVRIYPTEENGFEFEIELPYLPTSNEFQFSIRSKNLVFYKQLELTEDELDRGYTRSENIINSYAVYHESKQHNEYKTGKTFHIFRPKAHDANGNEVWGDLDINTETNILTVTIPQEFLNNAVYPVIVDPTIGYDTVGGSSVSFVSTSQMRVLQAVAGAKGTIDSMSVYFSQTQKASGSDAKGSLLCYAATSKALIARATEQSIPNSVSTAAAWYTNTVTGSPEIADTGATYDLVFWTGQAAGTGTNISIFFDTGGASVGANVASAAYSSTVAIDPEPALSNSTNRYSIYLTYTAVTKGRQLSPLYGTNAGNIIATPRYISLVHAAVLAEQTSDLAVHSSISSTGELQDFTVTIDVATGAGGTRTFTVFKNNVATAMTVTFSGATTEITYSTTKISVQAGDALSVEATFTGTPNAITRTYVSVLFNADRIASNLMFANSTTLDNAATQYRQVIGAATAIAESATESNVEMLVPCAGTLRNLMGELNGALTAGSFTFTLMVNNVASALTATISGTVNTMFSDMTNTVAVVKGDTISLRIVPAGGTTPATRKLNGSMTFVPTIPGQSFSCMTSLDAPSSTVTQYEDPLGPGSNSWSATEANERLMFPNILVKGINAKLNTAPGTSKSFTFALRKNATSVVQLAAISGAGLTAEEFTTPSLFANTDFVSMQSVPAGTPADPIVVMVGILFYSSKGLGRVRIIEVGGVL